MEKAKTLANQPYKAIEMGEEPQLVEVDLHGFK
jgi:hypothetical protein